MNNLSFSCASCGHIMSIGREFSGARVECSDCRQLTAVPGPRTNTVRTLHPDAVLPAEILGIEIKFRCEHCSSKLMIDFRWQGRPIDCPCCERKVQVPRCSDSVIDDGVVSPPSIPAPRLSPEELAFLSEMVLPSSS